MLPREFEDPGEVKTQIKLYHFKMVRILYRVYNGKNAKDRTVSVSSFIKTCKKPFQADPWITEHRLPGKFAT